MRSVLLGLMVVVAAGCSDPLSPSQIVGGWNEAFSIAGSFRHLMLDTSTASELFGGGNFCGEAGPCGTFTITGSISGDRVHLVFSYSNGTTNQFDGRLVDPQTLRGVETSTEVGGPSHTATFERESRTAFTPVNG